MKNNEYKPSTKPTTSLLEWGARTVDANTSTYSLLVVEVNNGYCTSWTWNLRRTFQLKVVSGSGVVETKKKGDGSMYIDRKDVSTGDTMIIAAHTWHRYIGKNEMVLHEVSDCLYDPSDSNCLDSGGIYNG